jgi:hypothetical protein
MPLTDKLNTTRDGRQTGQPGVPFERGTYDDEFGNPGDQSDVSAAQDQRDRDAALGGAKEGSGDYSLEAQEKRQRYAAWANEHGKEIGPSGTTFINPGAADFGGRGGVEYYKGQALEGERSNDGAQAANSAAMANSLGNMRQDRGQLKENHSLSTREAALRQQQMGSLDLNRQAALGNAPSEAAFQTRIGMNDLGGQQAGAMGSARGLAGLGAAQSMGGAAAGSSASNLAMAGGLARSKEIGDAMGMYGSQAGDMAQQDLGRLATSNKLANTSADQNDSWKLGNAELAAQQGQLGVNQGANDLAWTGESQRGAMKQFEYDQRMAAIEAGHDADTVAQRLASNRESKENTRQLVNGGISAGLGAVGSLAGPVGTAGGAAAGQAIGSATKDWW